MSVFIDKLNKITHAESTPIGFRRNQATTSERKIQLVSLTSKSEGDNSGEDTVLLDIRDKGIEPESLSGLPDDIPWGAWLKDSRQKELKQLKDAGCDFIVFPAESTALEIIEEPDLGKILELDTAIGDPVLRSVADLPVDAVLVSVGEGKKNSLTWHDLMILQRFGGFPEKPLLARIPAKVSSGELEALWETGVMAVVVESNIDKLRKTIDKADFTKTRKREKNEPVIRQANDNDIEDEY
ncbi:MAG: hypothetical protein JSU79_00630 [Dehalococcoidales bacterium]|nr:MAG: hypothetical protein JSU79_00630 [Dehalococcoidales bacterium]